MMSWQDQSQFYCTTLHEWVRNNEVSLSNGANLAHGLRDTLQNALLKCNTNTASKQQLKENNNAEEDGAAPHEDGGDDIDENAIVGLGCGGEEDYAREVADLYKIMMDGLMSSVHRSIPFYHVNRSYPNGFHVTKDEEETQLRADPFESDEEDDEDHSDLEGQGVGANGGNGNGNANNNGGGPNGENGKNNASVSANPTQPTPQETRARKREEMRKRRQEDEELLLQKRQVKDDKGQVLDTIGPHPPPRLVIRSAKSTQSFPSRKTLQQRLQVDQAIELSENDDDTVEDENLEAAKAGSSSSVTTDNVDAVVRLTEFLAPLSMDSLKKISESAKVRIKASQPASDFIYQIVKTAVRCGCEKAVVLMDKNTFLDAMTTHANLAARPSIELLRTLPPELRESLGPALGLTKIHCSEHDMWERIVALGLLSVLNNLHLRPLKKITQELGLNLDDMDTTEKYCEAILFAVFPKEKQRIKNSKRAKNNMGVAFNVCVCVCVCAHIDVRESASVTSNATSPRGSVFCASLARGVPSWSSCGIP